MDQVQHAPRRNDASAAEWEAPDEPDHFLIKRHTHLLEEVTGSKLAKVN